MLILVLVVEGGRSWKQNGSRKYREDVSAFFTFIDWPRLFFELVID